MDELRGIYGTKTGPERKEEMHESGGKAMAAIRPGGSLDSLHRTPRHRANDDGHVEPGRDQAQADQGCVGPGSVVLKGGRRNN